MNTIPGNKNVFTLYSVYARIIIYLAVGIIIVTGSIVLHSLHVATGYLHPPRKKVPSLNTVTEISGLQRVTFVTVDNVTIRGWYLPSHNHAAVIIAHGFGENRMQLLFEARTLADQGYGILLFDWRAHGESDGTMVTWGDKERNDLQAAIDFISHQRGIHPDRIGALGFSMGGSVVTEVAARDTRLAAVVVAGIDASFRNMMQYDFPKWKMWERFPVLWAVSQNGVDIDAICPDKMIGSIHPRPVFLINGSNDDMPPAVVDRILRAAGKRTEYWLVKGAGHGEYARVAPTEYKRRLLAFFDAALLNKPTKS